VSASARNRGPGAAGNGPPTDASRDGGTTSTATFRTIYAGSSLLACLLEVLAHFGTDARISTELDEIVEDDEDKVLHPTIAPGLVPKEWLEERSVASAELSGITVR
jgi:hypothetical protein